MIEVSSKYDTAFRMLERIGEVETLSKADIIHIHDTLIGRIGGSYGIRDNNLLESVVTAPYQCIFENELFPTIFDKAGKYMFDFCNYQIFVDGNKRTGIASAQSFLKINGYEMTFTNEEIYELAIGIATGKITDALDVGKLIQNHTEFLKENDYEEHEITDAILRSNTAADEREYDYEEER